MNATTMTASIAWILSAVAAAASAVVPQCAQHLPVSLKPQADACLSSAHGPMDGCVSTIRQTELRPMSAMMTQPITFAQKLLAGSSSRRNARCCQLSRRLGPALAVDLAE